VTAAAPAARSEVAAWRWLAVAAVAVVAIVGADYWRGQEASLPEAPPPARPADLRPGPGPRTFAEALAGAEREVAGARAGLAGHPGEWLRIEDLARALMARHRLTGDAADLAEADRVLDRAMASVPWPAGPVLSRAAVSLAVHDLAGAERALDRFDAAGSPPLAAEQADARSMRCEIAYQRGRVSEARRLCGGDGDLSFAMRRARIAAATGRADEAVRLVEDLMRRPGLSPQTIASLALQRASLALASGDWPAAGRWARAAERAFPGYWLGEAYLAQQFALDGDRAEALRRYALLAERTGHPDVLDALARLAAADGRADDARRWAERAGAAWRERSAILPRAYAAHHAEHLLLNGDPSGGLALARADYRRRPHPTTIVRYAFALWRNGEAEQALAVVRQGEAAGFATADIKLAESAALAALGRAAEAGKALAEARRRNPRIDSLRQQFVAFGIES